MTDEVVLPEDELPPELAVMDAPEGAEPETVGQFSLEPAMDEIDDESEDDECLRRSSRAPFRSWNCPRRKPKKSKPPCANCARPRCEPLRLRVPPI